MLDLTLMASQRPLEFPVWLKTTVTVAGEVVLLIATVSIISAMWLPAYFAGHGWVSKLDSMDGPRGPWNGNGPGNGPGGPGGPGRMRPPRN